MFCLLSLYSMLYLLAGEGVGAANLRAAPGGTHSSYTTVSCLIFTLNLSAIRKKTIHKQIYVYSRVKVFAK